MQLGVSAQEVQKLYPELVSESDGYLSVAYDKLSVVALAAVDKLHEENEELKERLDKLEKLVEQLIK
jgi:F0F1-type ATP synthase epsilon subunit